MPLSPPRFVATCGGSYPGEVSILVAALVVTAAVVAWTAWEAWMAARLRLDTRPLVARNAAVAGAHRLSTVGQVALVALAAVVAAVAQVPLWWSPVAVATPLVGALVTVVLVAGAAAAVVWARRRGRAPQDRRALLAVVATAVATEVLLRGLMLGLLDAAGWSVTVAVLLAALATGLLQAWRGAPGSRAFGFVLATVLGVGLGLVVLLSGSVLAAAAVHVVVMALGLARTIPSAAAAGCACGGHDHDHGPTSATPAVVTTGAATTGAATTGVTTATGAPAATDAGAHASCGSTCDHAGSSACAVCPLSTARV